MWEAKLLAKLLLTHIKYRSNGSIHIIVLVLAETTTEYNTGLLIGKLLVLGVELSVFLIVYRVVRLIACLPLRRVLTADNSLWQIIAILILAELEPLVLDDTCPWSLTVCIVDSGIALEVRNIEGLILKAH